MLTEIRSPQMLTLLFLVTLVISLNILISKIMFQQAHAANLTKIAFSGLSETVSAKDFAIAMGSPRRFALTVINPPIRQNKLRSHGSEEYFKKIMPPTNVSHLPAARRAKNLTANASFAMPEIYAISYLKDFNIDQYGETNTGSKRYAVIQKFDEKGNLEWIHIPRYTNGIMSGEISISIRDGQIAYLHKKTGHVAILDRNGHKLWTNKRKSSPVRRAVRTKRQKKFGSIVNLRDHILLTKAVKKSLAISSLMHKPTEIEIDEIWLIDKKTKKTRLIFSPLHHLDLLGSTNTMEERIPSPKTSNTSINRFSPFAIEKLTCESPLRSRPTEILWPSRKTTEFTCELTTKNPAGHYLLNISIGSMNTVKLILRKYQRPYGVIKSLITPDTRPTSISKPARIKLSALGLTQRSGIYALQSFGYKMPTLIADSTIPISDAMSKTIYRFPKAVKRVSNLKIDGSVVSWVEIRQNSTPAAPHTNKKQPLAGDTPVFVVYDLKTGRTLANFLAPSSVQIGSLIYKAN